MQHPSRMGWDGRISAQLGGKGLDRTSKSNSGTDGWTWPTLTVWVVLVPRDCRDKWPLAPRCFLPFPLLNLCCFGQTRQRHAWSLRAGLFFPLISVPWPHLKPTIPLEGSSDQPALLPVQPLCMKSVAGTATPASVLVMTPGASQITRNCSSKWGYLKTKLYSVASLVPSPRQPRWQNVPGRKGQ